MSFRGTSLPDVDLSHLVLIAALVVGGYFVKSHIDRNAEEQRLAMEEAAREEKAREQAAIERREASAARQRAERERHKQVMAARAKENNEDFQKYLASRVAMDDELRKTWKEEKAIRQRVDDARVAYLQTDRENTLLLQKAWQFEIITKAEAEILQAEDQLAACRTRLAISTRNMEAAKQNNDQLVAEIDSMQRAHGTTTASAAGTFALDYADQIALTRSKQASATREYDDAFNNCSRIQSECSRLEALIVEAKQRKAQAIELLRQYGETDESIDARLTTVATERVNSGSSAIRIYVLKDGRRISVRGIVDNGQNLTLHTPEGATLTVKKGEVEKIIDQK